MYSWVLNSGKRQSENIFLSSRTVEENFECWENERQIPRIQYNLKELVEIFVFWSNENEDLAISAE